MGVGVEVDGDSVDHFDALYYAVLGAKDSFLSLEVFNCRNGEYRWKKIVKRGSYIDAG
jgi:hypothetical protein